MASTSQATISQPSVGDDCRRWNYAFKWTDKHVDLDEMDVLRYKFDQLGSTALEMLQEIVAATLPQSEDNSARPDMYQILRGCHGCDEVLTEFWDELHHVPEWVDWEQIERGQKFFARYIMASSTSLALQGFVSENSASPGAAEVTSRTGGFAIKNLLVRVFETFTWLIHITNSLESIQPGGQGHTSTIRIRLLHASVRQRILKLTKSRPEYFDIKKIGIPISHLDSVHAIALFCCNPMWFSFPKLGIFITKEESADFLALFRYIAYLLGTPHHYFETPERARAVMQSMIYYEQNPNQTSSILAHNFIRWLEDSPPVYLSRGFIEAGCRVLNGGEMCDALGLGKPGLYYYCLFYGHNVLVSMLAYAQRLFPAFDRFVVKYFRQLLYNTVTSNRQLADPKNPFHFKYVPSFDIKFGKEVDPNKAKRRVRFWRPLEFVFLAFFLAAVGVCGGLLYGVVWGVKRVVGVDVPGILFGVLSVGLGIYAYFLRGGMLRRITSALF
ncbi:hypothetical protein B0J14DRAFT_336091 [Halenospora varia]|nr:hypothetical protein B0J14DRAFT_336091 [Halenospora varia]